MISDDTVSIGDMALGVRGSGTPDGLPVLHFHGTPSSRLEMAWADEVVARAGVHLVVFDRPGYGRSTQVPFSLSLVAGLGIDLADRLGWQRFATSGLSGGGPFALATAAVAGGRVSAVGIMSGVGPFQQVPGALEGFSGGDAEGAALLVSDREAAALAFAESYADLAGVGDESQLLAVFKLMMSERDHRVLGQPRVAAALLRTSQEAFRQGSLGCGWDNVAWVGEWDFALDAVRCPVRLWYGDEDILAPPSVATWLAQHLPNAELTMRRGYGHLVAFEHLAEMLGELNAAATGT